MTLKRDLHPDWVHNPRSTHADYKGGRRVADLARFVVTANVMKFDKYYMFNISQTKLRVLFNC